MLLWVYHKKQEIVTDNTPVRRYVNKEENRMIFEIKTRYYLENFKKDN